MYIIDHHYSVQVAKINSDDVSTESSECCGSFSMLYRLHNCCDLYFRHLCTPTFPKESDPSFALFPLGFFLLKQFKGQKAECFSRQTLFVNLATKN